MFGFQVIDLMNFGIDDLFIVLRVCANVLAGFGFVYNRDEFIEGYSDWLWIVLLLPILSMLGTGDPMAAMWAAKSLSLVFGILTLVMLFLLALEFFREREDRSVIASLAVLALASSAPFAAWSVGALETTLCAFLFSLAVWCILRSDRFSAPKGSLTLNLFAGVVLGLSLLTRPEAVLHVAMLIGVLLLLLRWKLRSVAAVAMPIIFIFGAFLIWRWQTYHALLPNTFTAKTGSAAGGLFLGTKYYLASVASTLGPLLILIGFGFLWFRSEWRKLVLLLSFILSTTIFTIYAGGDWMPAARFLIPVVPLLILIAIRGGVIAVRRVCDLCPQSLARAAPNA